MTKVTATLLLVAATVACSGEGFEGVGLAGAAGLQGGSSGASGSGAVGAQGGSAGASGSGAGTGGTGAGSAGQGGSAGAPGGAGGSLAGAGGGGGTGGTPSCDPGAVLDPGKLPAAWVWPSFSYQYGASCMECQKSPCTTYPVQYAWQAFPPQWKATDVVRFNVQSNHGQNYYYVTMLSGTCGSQGACSVNLQGDAWLTVKLIPSGNGYQLTVQQFESGWALSGSSVCNGNATYPAPQYWTEALQNSTKEAVIATYEGMQLPCP